MPSPSESTSPASPTPPSADSLRDGRYVVVGSLGAGSQAETLDAVDKLQGVPVAIKRFHVQHARSWKDVELAQREASVLAALQHPKLPRYVDHFEEAGALYLVMEKVEGKSLATRGLRFDQQQILRFLTDAGECLQYLHGRAPPIVHRDIKPGNVIQRPDGTFCIVDFGSVRDRLKPAGGSTVVGTFGFMAPEQFQGRALPASDVYGVGATALSLLTGCEPQDLPHKGLAIDVKAALQGQVERRLIDALGRMLEPDPEKRAPSVFAALTAAGLQPSGVRAGAPRESEAKPQSGGAWRDAERKAARAREKFERKAERAREEAERKAARRGHQAEQWAEGFHEHRERHYEKHARKRAERALRHRRRVPPGVALGVFLLIALQIAAIATSLLFAFALPLVLRTLAMFDRRLLRVADRMQELSERGQQGLAHASEHVRHYFLGGVVPGSTANPNPSEHGAPDQANQRVRVSDVTDTEAETVEPDASEKQGKR